MQTNNDTMHNRALHYLYSKLKRTRISLLKAEEKPNSTEEIRNLQNKIEVLEYLTDVVLKDGGKDD